MTENWKTVSSMNYIQKLQSSIHYFTSMYVVQKFYCSKTNCNIVTTLFLPNNVH